MEGRSLGHQYVCAADLPAAHCYCYFRLRLYSQAKGNWEENQIWPSAISGGWGETCLSKGVWSVGFSPFQDIVLTLKDKLSIRAIEYFALVLEQQYSITKLLLLHEDELIQKVKEMHNWTHKHVQIQPSCSTPFFFVFTRWCRKKTPMTTDVCSGCVSSPETPQTFCRMIPLPSSICFCRSETQIHSSAVQLT